MFNNVSHVETELVLLRGTASFDLLIREGLIYTLEKTLLANVVQIKNSVDTYNIRTDVSKLTLHDNDLSHGNTSKYLAPLDITHSRMAETMGQFPLF